MKNKTTLLYFSLLILSGGIVFFNASKTEPASRQSISQNVITPIVTTKLYHPHIYKDFQENREGNIAHFEITISHIPKKDIEFDLVLSGSAQTNDFILYDELYDAIVQKNRIQIKAGETKRVISIMAIAGLADKQEVKELQITLTSVHDVKLKEPASHLIYIHPAAQKGNNTRSNLSSINIGIENNSHMEDDMPSFPIPGTNMGAHAVIHIDLNTPNNLPITYTLYNPNFSTPPPFIANYMTPGVDYTLYDGNGNTVVLPHDATIMPNTQHTSYFIRYHNDPIPEAGEMQRFGLTNLSNAYPANPFIWIGVPYYVYDDDGIPVIQISPETFYSPVDTSVPNNGHAIHQISAGYEHACAIMLVGDWTYGPLACWGNGSGGKLGNGTLQNQQSPMVVQPPFGALGWRKVSAGKYHTCGIASNHQLYCWGRGNFQPASHPFGVLGTTPTYDDSSGILEIFYQDDVLSPQQISSPMGVTGWQSVQASETGNCATTLDDQVYCWGASGHGTGGLLPVLANGGINFVSAWSNFFSPNKPIFYPENVSGSKMVSRGDEHGCAIETDTYISQQQIYCWGFNIFGQLGNGDQAEENSLAAVGSEPQQVTLPAGVTGWKSVTAGLFFTCAIANIGKTYCWGKNHTKVLGSNNTNIISTVPTVIPLPPGTIEWLDLFPTHEGQVCGRTNNLQIYCWGQVGSVMASGQDTIGTPTLISLPPGVTGWYAGSAGHRFACAKAIPSGKAYCWGNDHFGRMGNGPAMSSQSIPSLVNF